MKELDKVLDAKEKIQWENRPKFLPFVLGAGALYVIISSIIILPLLFLGYGAGSAGLYLFLILAFVIGAPVYHILVYPFVHYAITNKRVIIQKGLIGRDFDMVDFDKITDLQVNVGVVDKLFGQGSGSILVATAGRIIQTKKGKVQAPYTLRNIPNPYEVFKTLKKVSHAVKTDIHFPNEYRPRKNKGYNTKLEL